jgi:alpha-L-fucosidase
MSSAVFHLPGTSRLLLLVALLAASPLAARDYATAPLPAGRRIAAGPFQATWDSLIDQYRCPEWFRDAKLGIWAHWSAQCVPGQGDWYARSMYLQGHKHYEYHVTHYGHPSEAGFMEIDHRWTADRWDPEALMQLYVAAGAKFFVALANHEDNFDCYDSKYHAWNSVNVGPRRDIVGTWARVARAHGLRFGVSNHSAHAWHWLQPAYGYDAEGPRAGVRYDAFRLTKADGKGRWWDGLDPQELYGRPSTVIPDGFTSKKAAQAWHDTNNLPWTELPPPHDQHFVDKWFFRLQDLIDHYRPDFLYLDDTELPLGQAGLDIAAHYYNQSMATHGGKLEAVLTAKGLSGAHRPAVVQAWERSVSGGLQAAPFETDTCIGQWHYQQDIHYKSVGQIVRTLVDVVSKNGTLLLSVPQRGDGTIDDREAAFLHGMARWIGVNGEGIFGSRPWTVFGEGPTEAPRGRAADDAIAYTPADLRFTTKDGQLYVFALALPTETLVVRALGRGAPTGRAVRDVALVGSAEVIRWRQDADALRIEKPAQWPSEEVVSFKIALQ